MQLDITLTATPEDTYIASDLGYLLHKNPTRVFARSLSAGMARVFYSEVSDQCCTAVLHLSVDPIALVRGKNKQNSGLLDQYVNDRPFVANSLLSVAINKCYAQSLSGKSKERQALADTRLPLSVRVGPIACGDANALVGKLFEPLGYTWQLAVDDASAEHGLSCLCLTIKATLCDVLNHLYTLIPVMDNAKHWWVDESEIDTLLAKGGQWLSQHPHRELITRRALKHRRDLAEVMLDRLAQLDGSADGVNIGQVVNSDAVSSLPTRDAKATTANALSVDTATTDSNTVTTRPVRLHDQRLDRVADILAQRNVNRVLDIGCGEGKLVRRLLKHPGFTEIIGVDPSLRSLKKAHESFYLDETSEGVSDRLTFQLGSMTYADRRLRGFDAATLVEVIEHIDPARLVALRRNLFGDARPTLVIITTPNADYNAMYESLTAGEYRHDDHRFEWTRAEFAQWCGQVAKDFDYQFEIEPLGPVNEDVGAPSQLVIFSIDHASSRQPKNNHDSAVTV